MPRPHTGGDNRNLQTAGSAHADRDAAKVWASGLLGDGKEESITVAEWAPLVDITEDDKEYTIKTELPEVKKEDVKVGSLFTTKLSIDAKILTLRNFFLISGD